MKKLLVLISLALLAFGLGACTNTNTTTNTTIDTREISLQETTVEMPVGSEFYIDYSLNFDLLESESIAFLSSNSDVAEVNQLGKVIAKGYGECMITLSFDTLDPVTLAISVSSTYEINLPNKTLYQLGESISVYGAKLSIYDESHSLVEEVTLTSDMLEPFEPTTTGSQMVTFQYMGLTYGFEVYILNEKQEASLFDDCFYLNETLSLGEKVELALTKSNTEEFLQMVNNVYDYEEINIYALIEAPSGETKIVSAFWYQDYEEKLTNITVNSNLKLEGKVNDTTWDYDVFLQYSDSGNPHYRFRFLPEEAGEYHLTIVVEVDGVRIQTLEKSLTISEAVDDDFKGFIQVNTTNNRTFVFDNGETYMAVGQNVAWYTSVERKYYDYKSWFPKMSEAGMNYARVWMAAWGYSLFWDDIYNYDERQTNLYSLDQTIHLADENNIYIQLCLLHHGMFSSEVNPMWPGSEETWYTTRYGTNPYASLISNSGLFFASTDAKDVFQNQLKYIVARYGYSDNIMSWELFNEVDWIETYTSTAGNLWHDEMAQYIDSIDPNQHMITTSLNNQTFLSNNYKVFDLDSIDYVNVHHYGIYNHVDFLPTKQNNVFEIFDKPVIYDEVGYQGWGGQDQIDADPNNVTLHQALWGGALGGGAGTAMNWWWESWIETYDVYSEYSGIATYASYMDLTGTSFQVVASSDADYNVLTTNSLSMGYIGYLVDNRVYLYIYDKSYNLDNQDVSLKTNQTITVPNLANGTYELKCFDTYDGSIYFTSQIQVINNQATITLPNYYEDVAIIFQISE